MNEKIVNVKIIKELAESFPYIFDDNPYFELERYESKKNIVFCIKFNMEDQNDKNLKDIVVKIFKTQNADIEYKILSNLKKQGHFVPKIIDYKKPYLILEKVEGTNLCDYINNKLKNLEKLSELENKIREKLELSMKMLADWLARFHKESIKLYDDFSGFYVLNKGDIRLRDFIINFKKGKIYGLDFEDCYEGNFLEDLAGICCALLDTNPGIFELGVPYHKLDLIKIFLDEYFRINKDFQFNFKYFATRLIENLNIVIERRNIGFGPINKEAILRRIGEHL
ncbi:MAG: hypothetical protein ACTSVV_07525 [Promethearchaeota archaeon]